CGINGDNRQKNCVFLEILGISGANHQKNCVFPEIYGIKGANHQRNHDFPEIHGINESNNQRNRVFLEIIDINRTPSIKTNEKSTEGIMGHPLRVYIVLCAFSYSSLLYSKYVCPSRCSAFRSRINRPSARLKAPLLKPNVCRISSGSLL